MFAHAQGRFAITVHSPHLDLSWSQDPALPLAGSQLRQFHIFHSPTPMAQHPRERRLTSEQGILWVCGQRLDESARVRVDTESVVVLRFAHE